ncbi:MAG: universal stress protein [Desulfobacteraceae bacterium]|jgi:nucleotide-binding universal stress UspA family protein
MDVNQKRILVTIDGSDQSLDAVRYVGKILAAQKIEVVLFHVKRKIPDTLGDAGMNRACVKWIADLEMQEMHQEKRAEKTINQARQILLDEGFSQETVTLNIHESKVGVARDILDESKAGYSAIVVGRKGLSRLQDLVLGSVANKLIERLGQAPIWVAGGNPDPGKILLGLDPSQGAMKAVDHLGNILGGSDSKVTLLHVVRDTTIFEQEERSSSTQEREEWLRETELVMSPVFEEAKTRLMDAGFGPGQVITRFVTDASSRADTIVEQARLGRYGTIVIGRRGMSRIEEFVMGRVSNKVLQLARDMAVWIVS